ncbi:hypothetical protein VDGL01_08312 [Verticillium dahliae]
MADPSYLKQGRESKHKPADPRTFQRLISRFKTIGRTAWKAGVPPTPSATKHAGTTSSFPTSGFSTKYADPPPFDPDTDCLLGTLVINEKEVPLNARLIQYTHYPYNPSLSVIYFKLSPDTIEEIKITYRASCPRPSQCSLCHSVNELFETFVASTWKSAIDEKHRFRHGESEFAKEPS